MSDRTRESVADGLVADGVSTSMLSWNRAQPSQGAGQLLQLCLVYTRGYTLGNFMLGSQAGTWRAKTYRARPSTSFGSQAMHLRFHYQFLHRRNIRFPRSWLISTILYVLQLH